MEFTIRKAKRDDANILLEFINHLAVYEKLEHESIGTVESIETHMFDNKRAEGLILEVDGKPIGIAIYFYMFSTFYTKPTLYLEDLFILEKYRNKGYGKQVLKKLNEIALENECVRFEWSCLDWNEPSIKFYEKMGAKGQEEWIRFRLDEEGMNNL